MNSLRVCLAVMMGSLLLGIQIEAVTFLESAKVKGGFVVHLGCGDGKRSMEFAPTEAFKVQGWTKDANALAKARENLRLAGSFKRVSFNEWDGKSALPYATHFANAVICDLREGFVPPVADILRVLVPNGVGIVGVSELPKGEREDALIVKWKALLASSGIKNADLLKQDGLWLIFTKPQPPEFDEWAYWRHEANGNIVSRDRAAGVPGRLKWIDGQVSHSQALRDQAMVSAGGRLFAVIEESEPAITGPVRPRLSARDAYNGLLLWKKDVPSFYSENPEAKYLFPEKAFFATSDRVYAVIDKKGPLVALNAATGKTIMEYKEGGEPNQALLIGGALFLSDGTQVCALDSEKGTLLWKKNIKIDREDDTLAGWVAEGERIILAEKSDCVALDTKTGKELWRTSVKSLNDLCFVKDGVVGVRNARGGSLTALSSKTGKVLWTYKYGSTEGGRRGWRFCPDFVLDGLCWVRSQPNEKEKASGFLATFIGLDLKTGTQKRRLPHKETNQSCTPWTFTPSVCLMGKRGHINFETGMGGEFDLTRNTCKTGFIVGNGLLYNLPIGCLCVTALRGIMATEPASIGGFKPDKVDDPGRFVKGSAFGKVNAGMEEKRGEAWPVYRSDPERNGFSPVEVPSDVKKLWQMDFKTDITAPVISGGRVYIGCKDANEVLAFEPATQNIIWRFPVEGTVDTPPTLYKGLCLFGTQTGWVYALRAADGVLVWKFRAAPKEIWIMAYGRPESAWPVHGTVLVSGGVLYFASGRHSDTEGGTFIYAAEPATGKILWVKNHRTGGESYRVDLKTGESLEQKDSWAEGIDERPGRTIEPGGRSRDILMDDILVDNLNTVNMRFWSFDAKDGKSRYSGGERFITLRPGASMVMETSYAQKNKAGAYSGWLNSGKFGLMLVSDGAKTVFGFTNKKKLGEGVKLFGGKLDMTAKGIRIKALTLTGSVLWGGGFDETTKEGQNPWAAWDGINGGLLVGFSTTDGSEKVRLPLPAIPVWDGMAAAGGRLYVSTKDGKLTCFGK